MHLHAAPARSSAASGAARTQTVLRISLVATALYVAVTFIFGLRAHSLALLSEAGHNLSDFFALLLSFAAVYIQCRPADTARTFGYQRAGVLAAFVNAVTLIVLSAWIAIEAVHRLYAPVAVHPRIMMITAAAGVIMNGVIAALLWGVARDVNLRSSFLHMAGDTLSTAAVIVGGAAILFSGHYWIDPVLSLIIAALILWSSWGIVRETLNILLEGAPSGVSPRTRSAVPWRRFPASSTSTTSTSGPSARPPALSPATSPSPISRRPSPPASWSSSTTSSAITTTSATPPSSSSTKTAPNSTAASSPWKR